MKRKFRINSIVFGLVLAAIGSVTNIVSGQMFPFGKNKTESEQALMLTDQAGPWLVMVTSFTGEDGRAQATRLAEELRNQHRMEAYIYEHKFNFKDKLTEGKGWTVVKTNGEVTGHRKRLMEPNSQAEFDEIAVLVGSFVSVEDATAQKTLDKIKHLRPQTMNGYDVRAAVEDEDLAGGRLRAWRDFVSSVNPNDENKDMGPLRAAFLLTNPLLPEDYFEARKVDQFVINLNSGMKHSLLKNTGTYSVKVASFAGDTTLDLGQMEKITEEDNWRIRNKKGITKSKLMDAAKKATLLTEELRRQGYDAYEFHDRHESYVCVGAFDWLTRTDENGMEFPNPDIAKTILTFKGESIYVPGKPNATKTFNLPIKLTNQGIACDAQPLPVLIPKNQEKRTAKRFLGIIR